MDQRWGGAAVWRWLDGHVNRETGVGAPAGRSALPVPTLGAIEQLLHALGHPQRRVPVVLVAGTNGKTTTARILAGLLDAAGLRVGCYTSPHLHRPHERIAIGTATITDDELAAVLRPLVELERTGSSSGSPTATSTWPWSRPALVNRGTRRGTARGPPATVLRSGPRPRVIKTTRMRQEPGAGQQGRRRRLRPHRPPSQPVPAPFAYVSTPEFGRQATDYPWRSQHCLPGHGE